MYAIFCLRHVLLCFCVYAYINPALSVSVLRAQDDPLVNINAREQRTKEAWIKIMSAREARNDLRECYRREGVNHLDNCSQFAKAYLDGARTTAHAFAEK